MSISCAREGREKRIRAVMAAIDEHVVNGLSDLYRKGSKLNLP